MKLIDKRKIKNNSWNNLKLGPKKSQEKWLNLRKKKICPACKEEFTVPISKNRQIFCSLKCKSVGQRCGLTKPMRKGTGMPKVERDLWSKYNNYRNKCIERGWEQIEYTLEEFRKILINGNCFYCNRKEWLGLDRIDNSKGYTKDNTVICCELCNVTRGNRFSYTEFIEIGKAIKKLNILDRRITKQNKETNIFMNQWRKL